MTRRLLAFCAVAAAVVCMWPAAACRATDQTSPTSARGSTVPAPPGSGLQAVALPDFSGMDAPVREQMHARYVALKSSLDEAATPDARAAAYGAMGMLLMAATHFEPAEACFLNAQTLSPGDRKWPYYLGHLYKAKGPLEKSAASFERALELTPGDVATLVWLGEVYLAQGRADAADPIFAKALSVQPSAAAWFGSGRAALAKREYARAVKELRQAQALDARATGIEYPLAMAYRGAGDLTQAEAHLARQGDIEPRPPDPLMREMDDLLQSAEAFNVRGGEALAAGDWAVAANFFRKGLALAPDDPSLGHRLGTALAQMGDHRGAVEQFERVVRTAPAYARSHFSLGVLMNASGRHTEAIERFSAALRYDPGNLDARVELAGALARSGRAAEALVEYDKALAMNPTHADASFGRAMTLVRVNRYQEARDALAAAVAAHPGDVMVSHALARLLAAAPDDRVRDGRRALRLVDALIKKEQTIQLAETTAMALAEIGRYAEAARVQRDVLTAARQAGLPDVERRAQANLELYEQGQPCRVPFSEDEMP